MMGGIRFRVHRQLPGIDSGEVVVRHIDVAATTTIQFQPLFKTDRSSLALKGRQQGDQYFFEGDTTQLPAHSLILSDEPRLAKGCAIRPSVGQRGISHGLYSIHIRMLDGITAAIPVSRCCNDGGYAAATATSTCRLLTGANGRWKGELVNHEHTPSQGERPVFAVRGSVSAFPAPTRRRARPAEATALVGKRSIRSARCWKKLARCES